MTANLKSKFAIGALVIAGLAFVGGISLLCHCPGPFVFAVPFALFAIFLGARWSIRLVAICLAVASIVMAVHQYERKQRVDGIVNRSRAQAATNSVRE